MIIVDLIHHYFIISIGKIYTISNAQGVDIMQGKITGKTQRTCLYVGDCKKGKYTFSLDDTNTQEFTIQ